MLRLGWQFSVRSGREARTRLIVTACGVAVGVAIMLCVLADFHAFSATNAKPCWQCTEGTLVSARSAQPAPGAELWNYGDDIFRGQTIERLEIAPLGPGAPLPPGVSRLPAAGHYYASPALAALLATVPADQLGDRFPGKLTGLIGQRALAGPGDLVIYIGEPATRLTTLPATMRVTAIDGAAGKQIWSPYFRDAFLAGAVAFLFPILILIGTATRLAAARREERFAALRLVGATARQISVIAAVESALSGLLGSVLGIGGFALLQPWLASTAITSARYFSSDVTPTAAGYLAVLVAVPAAAAAVALLSLRRVRISPLGVARKVTPAAPTAWRILPLLIGIVLFAVGMALTSTKSIGSAAFPGLIIVMIGLVVGGPWLTAQAARLAPRLLGGASPLLAGRRLADNPKAAFRSIRGLVLAVFLGTVVALLLPAANATTATPSARSLSNVLLAEFLQAPVCGNSVNCTGNGLGDLQANTSVREHQILMEGLPPATGATLLRELRALPGTAVYPVYSTAQDADAGTGPGKGPAPGNGPGPGNGVGSGPGAGPDSGPYNGIMSCASLRQLAVFGECKPGAAAVLANTMNMYGDNPSDTTEAFVSRANPAVPARFGGLYLQSVLIRVNSPATLERVRTFLATHTPLSASGSAPRTFGEAVEARVAVGNTVQRLVDVAVILTLLVAGCSLAVAVGGGLVERKRPFTLMRVSGTPTGALYRVVLLEAVAPLIAATAVALGTAYLISVLTLWKLAPKGTPLPVLGGSYYLTIGAGLAVSLAIIGVTLPLLGRISRPGNVRFE